MTSHVHNQLYRHRFASHDIRGTAAEIVLGNSFTKNSLYEQLHHLQIVAQGRASKDELAVSCAHGVKLQILVQPVM